MPFENNNNNNKTAISRSAYRFGSNGKTSPISQAKILEAPQIFLGMCNLWTNVCNFPVRLHFSVCLFSRRLLSLNPLVSGVLEVLREPLSSLLFSLASRYLINASSISILSPVRQMPFPQAAFWKAGLCDACFTILFSNKGEATSWALVPNCSELCQFPFAVLQGLWCCHKLLSSVLLFAAPRHPRYAISSSVLRVTWDRNRCLGQPLEKPQRWCIFHSFPPKVEATSWAFLSNC